jgi:hypothetical protein
MEYLYERLISLETAKLAKEKGFNIPVLDCINENEEIGDKEDFVLFNYNQFLSEKWSTQNLYSCPSQGLLQRWLREKHELFVFVNYRSFGVEECNGWYYHIGKSPDHYSSDQFKTYEEAMEEGLIEGLKQIQ